MAQADIKATITAEDKASATLKNFSKSVDGVNKSAKDSSSGFENLTKAVFFGNTIFSLTTDIVDKAKEAFFQVVDAAKEWQAQTTQLNAVLKSTHEAAGITSEKAIEMAEAIQKTTPVSRDSALAAENMLLTFTAIHKNVFPATTKAVVDMATAMNGGATPSAEQLRLTAIQVGKAMNDPIAGATALRRVGVQLTQQQQDQIKVLIAHHNQLAAQKIILGELSKEFGGSAVAATKTFSGAITQVKNNLIDVGVNALQKVIGWLTQLWNWFENNRQKFMDIVHTVGAYLKPSFDSLIKTFETQLLPSLQKLWKAIQPYFLDALKFLAIAIGVTLVAAMWVAINVMRISVHIWTDVINVIAKVYSWVGNVGAALINFAKNVPRYLSGVEHAIEAPFKAAFDFIMRGIHDVENAWNRVKNDVTSAPGHVTSGISGFFSHIPGFATGGTVPGAIGQPQLAIVHGGEQVVPVGQTQKNNNVVTVNLTVQAQAFMGSHIQARQFAKTIFKELQNIAIAKNTTVADLVIR